MEKETKVNKYEKLEIKRQYPEKKYLKKIYFKI